MRKNPEQKTLGRRTLLAAGASMLVGLMSSPAVALDKSIKTIRIVVGQSPGGSVDQTARAFAEHLTRKTGLSAVVENRPGGLGMIAASEVARAPANGATLLIVLNSNLAQAPVLLEKPPVNPDEDLVPIASFNIGQSVVAVRNGLPIRNVRELVEYSKNHPLSVGNFGIGTNWQMIIQHLVNVEKAQFTLVNYKGAGPMQVDFMAGVLDVASGSQVSMGSVVRAGKAVPLAVSGNRRSKLMPSVPTWSEQGFTSAVFTGSWESAMLLGPRGLPKEVVDELASLASTSMESDAMKSVTATLDADPPSTGQALKEHISRSWGFYRRLTKELGVKQ